MSESEKKYCFRYSASNILLSGLHNRTSVPPGKHFTEIPPTVMHISLTVVMNHSHTWLSLELTFWDITQFKSDKKGKENFKPTMFIFSSTSPLFLSFSPDIFTPSNICRLIEV